MGSWNYLICDRCDEYQEVCKTNYSLPAIPESLSFLEKHRRCACYSPIKYVFEDDVDFKRMKQANYAKDEDGKYLQGLCNDD